MVLCIYSMLHNMDDDLKLINGDGSQTGSEVRQLADAMGMRVSIYQYDDLPERLTQGSYIILIGNRSGHWVALRVMKHTAAYMDSFGVAPPQEITDAIGNRLLFWSVDEHQKLNMNHCAKFALLALYKLVSTT